MLRALLLILLAGSLGFAIDLLIGNIGLRVAGVPRGFPPFTLLPVLSGAIGGPVLATLAYSLIRAVSQRPDRTFLFVAIAALALSFALPIRLSFTKSKRFAGVTPAAQMILVLMHTVVATVSVTTILIGAKP